MEAAASNPHRGAGDKNASNDSACPVLPRFCAMEAAASPLRRNAAMLQWAAETRQPLGGKAVIRPMQASDLDPIMAIWLAANLQAHAFIAPSYWHDHVQEVRKALPQATVYVVEENGQIQGFMGLIAQYIAGLFVHPQQQSRGIGRRLLQYAKGRNETLTLQVYQKNARAVQFYLREQFRIEKRQMEEKNQEWELVMSWHKKGQTNPQK